MDLQSSPGGSRLAGRIRRIALISTVPHYLHGCMANGVRRYALNRPGWSISPLFSPEGITHTALLDSDFSGAIVECFDRSAAGALIDAPFPVINLCEPLEALPFPCSCLDEAAIVNKAIDHLLAAGANSLALVGSRDMPFARSRMSAFIAEAVARDLAFRSHEVSSLMLPDRVFAFRQWLRELPPRTGIFAIDDGRGRFVLDCLQQLGIGVPDQVLVLAVNDVPTDCLDPELGLSSISILPEQIGLEAARLLDSWIETGVRPAQRLCFQPGSIAVRTSTDSRLSRDPQIAQAMRLILRHATRGLDSRALADQVGLPRRSLDRRFTTAIGHGVAEAIRRVRVDHACALLLNRQLSITEIAEATGFPSLTAFSMFFSRNLGRSPDAWRHEQTGD